MPFSDTTISQAWIRAGGKCECTRSSHNHFFGRHGITLNWQNRGRNGVDAWEANHINRVESGGSDGLSNCEILCWDCHKMTF